MLSIPSITSAEEEAKTDSQSHQQEIKAVFYDSYGYLKDEQWHIPVKIWLSEDLGSIRKLTLKGIRKLIKHEVDIEELTAQHKSIFFSTAEDFVRDSRSNKTVSIRFKNDPSAAIYQLKDNEGNLIESDRNGIVDSNIVLSINVATQLLKAQNSRLDILEIEIFSDEVMGSGRIRLVSEHGVSIISDIDDTIKDTQIPTGHKTVLINTFFKEFKAIDEMSERYKKFPPETSFHYVSGAPWQLYRPINRFLYQNPVDFPFGSIHMKNVRTNFSELETYSDISKLMQGNATQDQKLQQINQLLKHFPKRKFIFFGDSGEYDPDVFQQFLKSHPHQITKVYIRDIKNEFKCNSKRLVRMEVIPVKQSENVVCDGVPLD